MADTRGSRVVPLGTRRHLIKAGLALAGFGLLSGCELLPIPGSRRAAPRRIGYLDAGINPPTTEAAFRDGMRDLGYVEGQSLVIEVRSAEGDIERLPGLAAELVSMPVEIIVVSNDASAVAAAG